MVLLGAPPDRDCHQFLHPGLPTLLLGSQWSATLATFKARNSRATAVQPRASSEPAGGNQGQGASSSSSSSSSNSSSSQGSGSSSWRMRLPAPSFTGACIGLGAGGIFYGGSAGKAHALWPFHSKGSKGCKDKGEEAKTKNVLIMMSNTGGGHRASAEALRDAFQEQYGEGFKISIVDMWKEHTPWPLCQLPDSYAFLVKHSILWRLSYEMLQPRVCHVPYLGFMGIFMRSGLSKAFDVYQPDLVVSVHPLMQHIPLRVLKQRMRTGLTPPINFATVITDFTTCHNTWFHRHATRCFVATDFAAMLARKNGLEDGQIIMHGLPIRPIFSKQLKPRRALRQHLGIDQQLPTVLLVGGGEGMGALEETVTQLDKQLGSRAQAVVICGRNQRLLDRLQGKTQPNGLVVHARGFVDNIHEWMKASNAIITKAGPGTIAEALISGLPILLNGNVPCQEEGNIPYVIDNEVGDFETRPDEIAVIMSRWLQPEDQHSKQHFEHMCTRSKDLGRPDAVYEIVRDLAKLAEEPDFQYGPSAVVFNRKRHRRGQAAGDPQDQARQALKLHQLQSQHQRLTPVSA